jgi:adenylate cyclase class IV
VTWRVGGAEVVLDELPFGQFLEIEGTEDSIREVEELLSLTGAQVETSSYPELTRRHGIKQGDMIVAKF